MTYFQNEENIPWKHQFDCKCSNCNAYFVGMEPCIIFVISPEPRSYYRTIFSRLFSSIMILTSTKKSN